MAKILTLILLLSAAATHAAPHGWEAKDETADFPLVAREGPVSFFDGMTIERRGDDAATIHVRTADGDKESFARFPDVRVGGP